MCTRIPRRPKVLYWKTDKKHGGKETMYAQAFRLNDGATFGWLMQRACECDLRCSLAAT